MQFDDDIRSFSVKFFSPTSEDDYYAEELNWLAALVFNEDSRQCGWRLILGQINNVITPKKREGLCIAVFESAVEDPQGYGWFDVLPELLSDSKNYWIIARAYKYHPIMLLTHIERIETEQVAASDR